MRERPDDPRYLASVEVTTDRFADIEDGVRKGARGTVLEIYTEPGTGVHVYEIFFPDPIDHGDSTSVVAYAEDFRIVPPKSDTA
ncbi:hypothetical protein GOEFS_050_00630 [Gordonia effusa NBRC 100432]|uniref:DUF4926 domain-containing protein n=1 Tax=Gordonia effusa NBRC 100432 TaxID=1077974 RepID=H0QZN4_9ACTN|nr:hypothetical protein [Gordonia effusa]GAB18285.1 hypothetical protein GOEFS_050_00630 [Gordonia effusa NBRC 100432]